MFAKFRPASFRFRARRASRGWLVGLIAAALTPAAARAQIDPADIGDEVIAAETFGLDDQNPAAAADEVVIAPSTALGIVLDAVPHVKLPHLSAAEWDAIYAEDAARSEVDKVIRYGFWRPVGADPLAFGQWLDLAGDGYLWVGDVSVPTAVGVRLQFVDMKLPAGAQVYVYSPDRPETVFGPYEGRGVLDSGEFWTPTTFGPTARVEYFVPASSGAAPYEPGEIGESASAATAFQIRACQHVYRDPLLDGGIAVGNCHNDVTCYSAWANVARASAGIGSVGTNALFCSGTMITNNANDQTPYWLTANHCIGSASAASNSEIFWLYQTSTCNGTAPSLSSVPRSTNCTRLSFSAVSDYSLLMVEGAIPSGLFWAGWSSAVVANGTNMTCIHHPSGSWKRISFATKTSGAAANFIRADWYDAPTEPGSSGSGLFRDDTQQLVGQLYGGPSACGNESYDDYGAFSTSYGSISGYLAAGSDDAYENNDTCATARAMSPGTYAGLVLKRYSGGDEDWYSVNVAANATLTVSLAFTNAWGNITLELYGACGGAVLRSSATTGNGESVTYTNGATAATYRIRAYLANDTRAAYSMTISTGGGGGGNNDACANAIAVTNGTYTGSTAAATRDGSATCGSSSTTRDVWYRYTAPRAGTLNVNTCGSGYDTVLSLHSGCPGTTTNQLVCNDDCGGSPCGGLNSCVSRTVTTGQVIYIRVSGYNGASGSFTLGVAGP